LDSRPNLSDKPPPWAEEANRCFGTCAQAHTERKEREKCIRVCRYRAQFKEDPPSDYVENRTPLGVYFFNYGVVLAFIGGCAWILWRQREKKSSAWSSHSEARSAAKRQPEVHEGRLAEVVARTQPSDADFSRVIFEDFAHVLYVETQRHRGGDRLALLAPFLSESTRADCASFPADRVENVIVGSMHLSRATGSEGVVAVCVTFTANYTEHRAGEAISFYAEEAWLFSRQASGVSRKPELARVIGCGNCGAPLDKIMGTVCAHCGVVAGHGKRDWFVDRIELSARTKRGPMLTGTTAEQGTSSPTIVALDLKREFFSLTLRDPQVTWETVQKRVALLFHTFHDCWSRQDLRGVRGFLSDNLFETQLGWIAAYQAEKLRNVSEQAVLVAIHLSCVRSDAHYDAMTVRVFGQCLDYTLDEAGKLVGGSREVPRRYSEYWTLIRARGVTRTARAEPTCPNCGAPAIEIGDSGECKSCRVKVTNGAYDWTLSRIEQDDVYTG
jgi:hypothetical protein